MNPGRATEEAPPASEKGSAQTIDVAALFRAHDRTIMRWAARLGGPGIDAEDVLQEVFLVANRRLQTFDGRAAITTWLFRTTERVVMSARRKRRLQRWLSRTPEAAVTSMSAAGPTPGEAFERGRDVAHVYRVLDRLPDKLRRILILFEIEQLSSEEIATLLDAKVATVRVWLFRARDRFQQEHETLLAQNAKKENGP
ncbi:MAG TPA: sigma-70 family RNA polymerase sigma factor [Polyangia bacterium]|nr:sigma-70 family RNA polymerase sigma factor [Polyangia bacterium]